MPPVLMILKTTGNVESLKAAYDKSCEATAGERGRGADWGIPRLALQHYCAFSDDAMYIFDIFESEEIMHKLVLDRASLPENLRPATGNMSSSDEHKKLSNNESLEERFKRDALVLELHVALPNIRSMEERPVGMSKFE